MPPLRQLPDAAPAEVSSFRRAVALTPRGVKADGEHEEGPGSVSLRILCDLHSEGTSEIGMVSPDPGIRTFHRLQNKSLCR